MCQSGVLNFTLAGGNESDDTRRTKFKFIPNTEPLMKAVREIGRVDVTFMAGETTLSRTGNIDLSTPVLNAHKPEAKLLSIPVVPDVVIGNIT